MPTAEQAGRTYRCPARCWPYSDSRTPLCPHEPHSNLQFHHEMCFSPIFLKIAWPSLSLFCSPTFGSHGYKGYFTFLPTLSPPLHTPTKYNHSNNMAVDTAWLGSLQEVVGSVANWKAHASLKEAASSCKNEHSELPSPLFFSSKSWKMLAFYAISQLFNVYF